MTELLSAAGGETGFYAKEVGGPVIGSLKEAQGFDPASTMKILVAIGILQLVDAGAVTLETTTSFFPDGLIGSCPQSTGPAQERTLGELIRLMLVPSNNVATRSLIDFLGGFDAVNQVAQSLGMTGTDISDYPGCAPNIMTQLDLATLYEALADGSLISESSRRALFARMPADGGDFSGTLARAQRLVDELAPDHGLTANQVAEFRSELKLHYKAGSGTVCTSDCLTFLSIAGLAEVPTCEGPTQSREQYVWGIFIHGAPVPNANATFRVAQAEPLREPIDAALAEWANCTTNDCLEPENVEGLPPWTIGQTYNLGTIVQHLGHAFECRQLACPAQVDWTPGAPGLTSLWQRVALCGTQPWAPGTAYAVDQIVSFGGDTYRCRIAHTAAPTWTPNVTLSLWVLE